jgi:hypothetical protein
MQENSGSGPVGGVSLKMNCCKTHAAPDRNRTEFIGERHNAPASFTPIVAVPFLRVAVLACVYGVVPGTVAPSPPAEDLPIFNSSLLI